MLIFVALVVVPPIALVIFFQNPTQSTFDGAAWIFAGYFAVAWMLLLGVIIRPARVTRQLLLVLVLIALLTQVPLALTLEKALDGNLSNLASSILATALPEELAKAVPVVGVALWMRSRRQHLAPVDYLFLGAVSGLVFGASEAEHYLSNGVGIGSSTVGDLVGVLNYVWRFLTDPITHACWGGLSGYFIGLAVSGQFQPFRVGWIGLALASVLHGLNDWTTINTHPFWVVIVLISAILLLGYAKAGTGVPAAAPAGPPPYPVPPQPTVSQTPPGPPPGAVPTRPQPVPPSARPVQPVQHAQPVPPASHVQPGQPGRPAPPAQAPPRPAASSGSAWWASTGKAAVLGASPSPVPSAAPVPTAAPVKKPWWEE